MFDWSFAPILYSLLNLSLTKAKIDHIAGGNDIHIILISKIEILQYKIHENMQSMVCHELKYENLTSKKKRKTSVSLKTNFHKN